MIMSKNEEQKCFQTLTEGRDHIIRRTVTSGDQEAPAADGRQSLFCFFSVLY